jgi:hypothetical protein
MSAIFSHAFKQDPANSENNAAAYSLKIRFKPFIFNLEGS